MRTCRRERQGSALILSILFLNALFALAVVLLSVLPMEMRSAGYQRLATEAYYAAEAGVLQSLAMLETRAAESLAPLPDGKATCELRGTLANWKWKVNIEADPQTPPNGTSPLSAFTLRSTAFLDGRSYRTVTVGVRQESITRYAWFEEGGSENLHIFADQFQIDGPFHTNGFVQLIVPPDFYGSSSKPTFSQGITSAGAWSRSPDGVSYENPYGYASVPPYDSSGRIIDSRYKKIFGPGGRSAVQTRAKAIKLSTQTQNLAANAWGSDLPRPSQVGVHAGLGSSSNQVKGGVYIVGDVDRMTLAEEQGNSVITIEQGGRVTRVVETLTTGVTTPDGTPVPQGSTMIVSGDQVAVYNGLTNGLVFSTGNIASLSGRNRGQRTVAVDVDRDKTITITGHLTRADTPVGAAPTGERDTLGVVGHNIYIVNNAAYTPSNPLNIYAALQGGRRDGRGASGQVGPVSQYGDLTRVRLFGSLTMGIKTSWGRFWDDEQIKGMTLESHYDSNLSVSPPPYFPGIGKFRAVSYQEEANREERL